MLSKAAPAPDLSPSKAQRESFGLKAKMSRFDTQGAICRSFRSFDVPIHFDRDVCQDHLLLGVMKLANLLALQLQR